VYFRQRYLGTNSDFAVPKTRVYNMGASKQTFDLERDPLGMQIPTLPDEALAAQVTEALRRRESAGRRLVVKSGTKMIVLRRDKVEWVEGEREYVRLHVGRESYLVRETMNAMERALGPANFIRVHRSTIVNLDHVREMKPLDCGDYEITMRDSTKLKLSRNHRARLLQLLQDSFRSEG